MITLEEIAKRTGVNPEGIDRKAVVKNITADSRSAGPGTLFVAVRGLSNDGHNFINDAVRAGSTAIVCQRRPEELPAYVSVMEVADPASALGEIASLMYGEPSHNIKVVGVTGTNGKTTVATLLYRLFTDLGYKCGLISTICNYTGNRVSDATHTTPGQPGLTELIAVMVSAGCEYLFMEVSSHAVEQRRIAGVKFAAGLFTNLTHDHLDYHGNFNNYLNAKKGFFDQLDSSAFALVNGDDRYSDIMLRNCSAERHSYSLTRGADFRGKLLEQSFEGMKMLIDGREVWTPFTGRFNASNMLAVYAVSQIAGVPADEALGKMSALKPVAGRMEIIRSRSGKSGVVDYAHTPDALKSVIETINGVLQGSGRLITVVGAGGDRDRKKRPLMGAIAAGGSDRLILTSDNPRGEDADSIIRDMMKGIGSHDRKRCVVVTDRREAIRSAVMMAGRGDVVLVAGKGHETSQEIMGRRELFDDREELKTAFMNEEEQED